MHYGESLDYLYGLQRFGIKLGLENIKNLLDALQHPEKGYSVIHVAGTNGKGSVSAALAEILQQAGYKTGLYTSPHLHCFTERIQVNRRPIPEVDVVELTKEIRALSPGVPATFFEFTTALALVYFARQKVDFAVLETGMGGRLDATNAITPQLTLITPISLDHVEHLGGDLATIAGEKAGILKKDVPVVIGAQEDCALEVLLAQSSRLNCRPWVAGVDYTVIPRGSRFTFAAQGICLENVKTSLPGRHQMHNMGQALAGALALREQGATLTEEMLRRGVESVRWPGRLEWWGDGDFLLLDGAHNAAGAQVLADYLISLRPAGVRWVFGMKSGRKPADLLLPLLPLVTEVYCAPPPVEEAVAVQDLCEATAGQGVPCSAYTSPEDALAAALAQRIPGEIVLVAGSLYLVAAARDYLQQQDEKDL
ncbi:folylpolyglutamate synthase/dihydrofolate synthase family protein [Desulfuromonas sp. AOP6]|uniref:bifunctional folylpolyglutamate synthase/dihydrofolate synthase n=1 Tax=Desulfuromonas sp. AOP6 TaxID=1566351 RepID=UPI001275660E|nr:folylpolyglutamate synthase/dihydrofolate synthase family protein [Desulfuromonas sp. AOP6]BCA80424.1 bifunctional folylpolyglutamatesynthase/dihydrofolate synthase [Desulfuromonas sp. AOP6]